MVLTTPLLAFSLLFCNDPAATINPVVIRARRSCVVSRPGYNVRASAGLDQEHGIDGRLKWISS